MDNSKYVMIDVPLEFLIKYPWIKNACTLHCICIIVTTLVTNSIVHGRVMLGFFLYQYEINALYNV